MLERLFTEHAPETLMAFFGAATSLLLFYLIWTILRQFFGLQTRTVVQEVDQEQAASELIKSLVSAMVLEAEHLRHTLDGILEESLKRGERNAEALSALLSQADKTPEAVLQVLKPEFDCLHEAIQQAEARITVKLVEVTELGAVKVAPLNEEEGLDRRCADRMDERTGENK